jgi:hypothetical protein
VGVKHHLLRLARVGPDEEHPAVAEPDVRHLHSHGGPIDQHDLMAPVELIGLPRRKGQRHKGRRRARSLRLLPGRGIAPDGIVAPVITKPPKFFVKLHHRQPLPAGTGGIGRQKPIQFGQPCAQLRARLNRALIAELGHT